MQIFNTTNKNLSLFKRLFLFAGILFFVSKANFISAQTMPAMPSFPEISSPSIGSGFYKPSVPYYPETPKVNPPSEAQGTKTEQKITNQNQNNELLNFMSSSGNLLTASDISSLSDSGLFSNLSSLYTNSNSVTENSNTVLLKQILENLEELKKENKTNKETEKTSSVFKKREPLILRFKINNFDLRDSITTVYFSEPENDGSFLLTADRRYVSGNKMLNETFYMLFKAKEGLGSSINYDVETSIMQDFENPNSFIYKLSKLKNLTAKKTGNLVVLRTEDKELATDLLLDVDN